MRSVILLATLLIGGVVSQYQQGWIDLFAPPFENCPTIMMAISCTSQDNCYVPGGQNGVGFGVFQFNGKPNGNFVSLNQPMFELMIMAIGAGGTSANPKGAVGGIGFGDSIQYFVNATTLMPSSQPFFVVTQDIRSSRGGNEVMVVDQGSNDYNDVLFSFNGGKNLTQFIINSQMPANFTFARYGSVVDADNWFVTLGSWPSNVHGPLGLRGRTDTYIPLSKRVAMIKDPKKGWRRVGRQQHRKSNSVKNVDEYGYSCVIAKTMDGGATWHNIFYETSTFYPNGIDCTSSTHCVFVAEGFDTGAGAHIFTTFDGLTFQQTLSLVSNSSGQFSLMSVKFNGFNEAWVAGSFESQFSMTGLFYHTMDGGKTWQQKELLQYIGEVTDLSFVTGGVGFATAITIFDDSTILRYDATGPTPTPAPPPWAGNFTQMQCTDPNCAVGCANYSFAQNVCLPLTGGGSASAQCQSGMLMQYVYILSNNCTGPAAQEPMPLDQCLQASGGGSFENFCGPSYDAPAGESLKSQRKQRT